MSHEIAAAPFVSLGRPDDDMPFLGGLRADVLSALSRRPRLKVYAATFDPTLAPAYDGPTLSVAAVRTEERLYVLISLRGLGADVRARTLDISLDVIATAAERIASLTVMLLDGERSRIASADAVLSQTAYEHLLLGRHHANRFTPADNETALTHFRAVLDEVPTYASALTGLAGTTFQQIRYGVLGAAHYATVPEAAEQAIRTDPTDVKAHVLRALVAMYHDRDLRAAADAFGDALALDRDHVDVLREYVWLLAATRHDKEAIAAIERALEYDPISVDLICTKAELYRYADDRASALALYRRAHALDLRYARAIEGIASMSAALGDRDEAFRYLDLYRRHAPNRYWRYRLMGVIAARLGEDALLDQSLRELKSYGRDHSEVDLSADLACIYSFVDPDLAMHHFNDAFHNGIGFVSLLRYAPLDVIRDREEYRALVAELDLDLDVPEVTIARTQLLHFEDDSSETLTVPKTAFLVAEAQRNYVTVHIASGSHRTRRLLRTSLSALVNRVSDPDLVRVHHSFVVNLGLPGWQIDGNAHTAALRLERLAIEVPVSRARYREIRSALTD